MDAHLVVFTSSGFDGSAAPIGSDFEHGRVDLEVFTVTAACRGETIGFAVISLSLQTHGDTCAACARYCFSFACIYIYPHRRRVIRAQAVRGSDERAATVGTAPRRNGATAGRRHLHYN